MTIKNGLTLVATMVACSASALAAPIAITNQGFELPVVGAASFTSQPTLVPGWTYIPSGSAGVFYPTAGWGYSAPFGHQVLYTNGATYEQTVAANVVANRSYTLRVSVVERPGYNNTYTIHLLAGATVVAQDNNTIHPPDGTAQDSVLVYNAPASGPTIGQPLKIRLGGTTQSNFDNVRLEDNVPVTCPGDVNGDGKTNVSDFNLLAGHFSQAVTPNTNGDLTGNGFVNVADFNILAGNFGCNG